ncbi:MAG: hypothetical protein ACOYNL_05155 [Rickettsiales bacterium]
MNKQKQLSKKLVKLAITIAVAIAITGGLFVGATMYADDIAKQKSDAESAYTTDNTLLNNLRTQMDTSGEAEKRFTALQEDHLNQNFSVNLEGTDGLNEFLREAKEHYHFAKLSMKPVKEVPSDKPALANFAHSVLVRPRLTLQIQAASDTHIFSFMEDLRRNAPGLVRIDKLELKRSAEMTDDVVTRISGGATPLLVDAKIEFTWIRIVPKEKKDDKAATAGGAPPVPAAPAP